MREDEAVERARGDEGARDAAIFDDPGKRDVVARLEAPFAPAELLRRAEAEPAAEGLAALPPHLRRRAVDVDPARGASSSWERATGTPGSRVFGWRHSQNWPTEKKIARPAAMVPSTRPA